MVANAALTYLPQVQMKSRCNVLELSLHKMKTLKHARKIKLKVKCKAYVSLTFALRVNAAC